MGVGRLGSGACSWVLQDFNIALFSCLQKFRNGNHERGYEGKLIPKNSSLSG